MHPYGGGHCSSLSGGLSLVLGALNRPFSDLEIIWMFEVLFGKLYY